MFERHEPVDEESKIAVTVLEGWEAADGALGAKNQQQHSDPLLSGDTCEDENQQGLVFGPLETWRVGLKSSVSK